MALESLKQLGVGGSGLVDMLPKILKELQGLKVAVLAGATATTKVNLAAIRQEDTVVSCLMFNTGVPSDVTSEVSISEVRATGTYTLGTVVADNSVSVNSKTYTFKAVENKALRHVGLTGSAAGNAAAFAAMINLHDPVALVATADSNVVTIKARAEGTDGNSIALTTHANIVRSGATLTGGTTTGGIALSTTNATGHQLVLFWLDKR